MIGLRSKLYYCFAENGKCKASHKGAQSSAFKTMASSDQDQLAVYRAALGGMSISVENSGFRALNGSIVTFKQSRKAFVNANDKRFRLPDGINTIPLDI